MVYVIKSPAYIEDEKTGEDKFVVLVKIGYIDDSMWKKEKKLLKDSNPAAKIFLTFPFASVEFYEGIVEKFLSQEFLNDGLREFGDDKTWKWFYYSEDMLKFLKEL